MEKDNSHAILTESVIQDFLENNGDWTYADDRLKAEYGLVNFEAAVRVMNRVFEAATKLNHHPRMTNTYNHLEFSLCTHSAGDKVTSLDLELAMSITQAVNKSAD